MSDNNFHHRPGTADRVGDPVAPPRRPLAAVSLDLDNLWAYMQAHGDPGWQKYPSYLHWFVPAALDFFAQLDLTVTFTIVGKDAALAGHRDVLEAIARGGHELANHSYHHAPWTQSRSRAEIENEIAAAEESIGAITGQKPVGYRGPGFSWSPELFEVLCDRGYLYDSSTLPTFIGPLARRYYFASSGLSRNERRRRGSLYGDLKNGWRPVKPYRIAVKGGSLLEIPVTTVPLVRTPFHLSYLMHLAQFSRFIALFYLRAALAACRAVRTGINFLMHPTDLLGSDRLPQLSYFPGMKLKTAAKHRTARQVLGLLNRRFTLVRLRDYAQAIDGALDLHTVQPV